MECKIIAEIGCNHGGDISLAKKMIDEAARVGADFVKFQTWQVKHLKEGPWMTDGRLDIYKKSELTRQQHYDLFDYCKSRNVRFLTSVFNVEDVEWLSEFMDIIKVPSSEIANKELLKAVDANFENIIISTGASYANEVKRALRTVSPDRASVLHCVSNYPCEADNVNLSRIDFLKRLCRSVGYSSHYFGIQDSIAALDKDISYLEKHFTIDLALPGRDNRFSLLPYELKAICEYRDNLDKFNIDKGVDMQTCELDTYNNYRGRWG